MEAENKDTTDRRDDGTIVGRISQGRFHDLSTILALSFLLLGIICIGWAVLIEERILDWHSIAGHVIRDIGIAAFVAGAIGIVSDRWVKTDFIDIVVKSLARVYERRQQFSEAGLKKTYERLDPHLLRVRSNKAARIRILQTWLGHEKDSIDAIREAADRGCKVEILLLDPMSAQVRYRASALVGSMHKGKVEEDIEERAKRHAIKVEETEKDAMRYIKNHLTELCEIRSDNKQTDGTYNVDVRVYDAAPTIQIYEFDRTKLIGVYWRKGYSVQGPQFEIVDSETSPLANKIDEHFKDLWKHESTRDASEALEEYDRWEKAGSILAELDEHWFCKSTGLSLKEYLQKRDELEPPEEGRFPPGPM